MKKHELKKLIDNLRTELEDLRHLHFKTASKVHDYSTSVGPLWTTRAGHRRPLGMLSTQHLTWLIEDGWLKGYPQHLNYAQRELRRREIDAEYRAAEQTKSRWARFLPWSS